MKQPATAAFLPPMLFSSLPSTVSLRCIVSPCLSLSPFGAKSPLVFPCLRSVHSLLLVLTFRVIPCPPLAPLASPQSIAGDARVQLMLTPYLTSATGVGSEGRVGEGAPVGLFYGALGQHDRVRGGTRIAPSIEAILVVLIVLIVLIGLIAPSIKAVLHTETAQG